jgi:hypothetical protein
VRRADGLVDDVGRGVGHLGDGEAGGRVDGVDAVRAGLDLTPADEGTVRDGGELPHC